MVYNDTSYFSSKFFHENIMSLIYQIYQRLSRVLKKNLEIFTLFCWWLWLEFHFHSQWWIQIL